MFQVIIPDKRYGDSSNELYKEIFLVSSKPYSADPRLRSLVRALEINTGVRYQELKIFKLVGWRSFGHTASSVLKYPEILLVNNRASIIPGMALKFFLFRKAGLVYDMRELYEISTSRTLKSKIGTLIERFFIKFFVKKLIVASAQRKRLIGQVFPDLSVGYFENIRELPESQMDFEIDLQRSESNSAQGAGINIVSTDGGLEGRCLDDLINNVIKFNGAYNLHIYGCSPKVISQLSIKYSSVEWVKFYGVLPGKDLREQLLKMDVGYVGYESSTRNGRYCASGKIFEFLSAGLPIVATPNPPLRLIVNKYDVGYAEKSLDVSLCNMLKGISEKKRRVNDFLKEGCMEDLLSQNVSRLQWIMEKNVEKN